MKFTKMQGIGNDYVYINCFNEKVDNPSELAVRVSERHFGIGSDGLILLCPSDKADVRMDMYNLDGSRSEMCGNGIRCVGKLAYDQGVVDKTEITVETLAGIKKLSLQVGEDGLVKSATVDMGEPVFKPEDIPVTLQPGQEVSGEYSALVSVPITVNGKTYKTTAVSMGNPHSVIFVDNTDELNLEEIGPDFENHPMFPKRVNTEFIQIIDRKHIKMRVWERGSGETLACGTGASASVAAAILNNYTDDEVTVSLLGGDLTIKWDKETNHVFMTGPATTVFEGVISRESGLL
jgi:diaminopimelate epimerase